MNSTARIKKFKRWKLRAAPLLGAFVGLVYGLVSQKLDFEILKNPTMERNHSLWLLIDTVVSVILPSVAGILAGIIYNHIRRQAKVNAILSVESSKMRRHLLTQTLSSHILHEIRNPVHNVTAVLENWQRYLPQEEVSILQRNLNRLRTITEQLSHWTLLDDEIDLREPVVLPPWFNDFIMDKVQDQFQRNGIRMDYSIANVRVNMHPLLLEQCFTMLINNAMEAARFGNGVRAAILSAAISPKDKGYVEIRIRNSGMLYPDTVLAVQGRDPVESQQGLGLGLVLVRRTLQLVGGSLALANKDGQANTTVLIPGQPA